jgi:hypothetical protein
VSVQVHGASSVEDLLEHPVVKDGRVLGNVLVKPEGERAVGSQIAQDVERAGVGHFPVGDGDEKLEVLFCKRVSMKRSRRKNVPTATPFPVADLASLVSQNPWMVNGT